METKETKVEDWRYLPSWPSGLLFTAWSTADSQQFHLSGCAPGCGPEFERPAVADFPEPKIGWVRRVPRRCRTRSEHHPWPRKSNRPPCSKTSPCWFDSDSPCPAGLTPAARRIHGHWKIGIHGSRNALNLCGRKKSARSWRIDVPNAIQISLKPALGPMISWLTRISKQLQRFQKLLSIRVNPRHPWFSFSPGHCIP